MMTFEEAVTFLENVEETNLNLYEFRGRCNGKIQKAKLLNAIHTINEYARYAKDNRLTAKTPHHTKVEYQVDGGSTSYYITDNCPTCFYKNGLGLWDSLLDKGVNFCRRCGQAIDWSEYDEEGNIDWETYMNRDRGESL